MREGSDLRSRSRRRRSAGVMLVASTSLIAGMVWLSPHDRGDHVLVVGGRDGLSRSVAPYVPGSTIPGWQSTAGGGDRPECVVGDDRGLRAEAAGVGPKDHYPHEEWLANDRAQASVQALDAAIQDHFDLQREIPEATGVPGTVDRLSRGLIGVAADHQTQSLVVVVDPQLGSSSLEALALSLSVIAGDALRVEVRSGCRSAADLLKAWQVLGERSWHPRVAQAHYSYYLEPLGSTFHVAFGPDDADVAEALKDRLPNEVTLTENPHRRAIGIGPVT